MDSYEECRGPPRLHLLDKFDTGGPGSCLKRYSDPTFFRRASAGFDEAYSEKLPRVKKARRRKPKKKTWIQNGDKPDRVNHGTPTSSHSARMHYASQNFDGQTFPSQTVSTYDAAVKLEMGNHSDSFDSRAASGYGECVFSPSYTLKFDGCETMKHSDTLDTSSLDEQRRVVDDDIQEQTGERSSCVTWYKKTEKVEPAGLQYHCDEKMEGHPTNFEPNPLEREACNIKTDYCRIESTLESVCALNQLDDIESETDNNMNSLDTIESESETDLECETKKELEQFSAINIRSMDGSINRLNPEHSDSTSSYADPHVAAHISTNVAISKDNHNLIALGSKSILSEKTSISKPSFVTSESYAKIQSPRDTDKSSIPDSLPSSYLIESDDITSPHTETVFRSGPVVQALKSDTVLSSPYGSQKSQSVPSRVTEINFWTNGGLLGLQPSKPPDFSALDPVNHDSMVPSSRSNILLGGENALETNIFKDSKMCKQDFGPTCTRSFHNDQEDIISIMKTSLRSSQAHSDSKHEHTSNLHHSFSSNQSHNLLFSETSTMVPGTKQHDDPDVQASKSLGYNCKNSARMFELSNKLLASGQSKVSSFGDDDPLSSFTSGISEQKSAHQAFQTFSGRTFIEQFGSGSPFISPSSSPPLEHMKISFQPIDGFQVSKLKLKFPDGSECHESSKDVFPSFQLVPDESISLQDIGSDSDDDMFCDYSPHGSGSDVCLSHYSESDSGIWETRESPRCNDVDVYDALCRNSTESVTSNLDVGRIAKGVVITSKSGLPYLFTEKGWEYSQTDLPSFDTLNDSFREDLHNDSEIKYQLDSDSSKDPTSPPPPQPSTEWHGMKPNPDMAIERQVPSFQALKHAFDQNLPTSTISQQPKPAPFKHDHIEAIASTTNSKHPDGQKLNVHKDANQSPNNMVADEKEDFLQQIRIKSFNLRRTIIERPNLGPGAPANVSVTAILEKANAIRQAVGNDDGEDDNSWSD